MACGYGSMVPKAFEKSWSPCGRNSLAILVMTYERVMEMGVVRTWLVGVALRSLRHLRKVGAYVEDHRQ